MLNYNEIADRRFDKAMGFGYKTEEVDNFLAIVADEYQKLLLENKDMENKMEIMAESIEAYRADEDSIKSALMGAQRLGDSIVRESRQKAEEINRQTEKEIADMLARSRKLIEEEKRKYIAAQKEVADLKNKIISIYKQHMKLITELPSLDFEDALGINNNPDMPPQPVRNEPPQETEEPAQMELEEMGILDLDLPDLVPGDILEELPAAEEADAPQDDQKENTAEQAQDDYSDEFDDEPIDLQRFYRPNANSSRFGPLKFGVGYDLGKDDE